MTPEQVQALHRRFRWFRRKEDGEALLRCHRGFARQIAIRYACSYLSQSEAMACAERGLYEAMKRYDGGQGAFTTFAFFWMQKFILAERATLKNVVRLPVSLVRKSRRVQALLRAGKSTGEIAEEMKLLEADVQRLADLHHAPTGVPVGRSGYWDRLPDTTDESSREELEAEERKQELKGALQKLDARSRKIVKGRFAEPPKSFGSLARDCRVSRKKAEAIFALAMRTLRTRLSR